MEPIVLPPRNELEALIARMQAGEIAPEDFAERILGQQVFMPVKDDKRQIAGFQSSTLAEPLVLSDEDGRRVLILFSVAERGKSFLAGHPGHGGGLVVDFAWVLRRIGAGMGISINPAQEPGFDFDPEMVAMLVATLPEQAQ